MRAARGTQLEVQLEPLVVTLYFRPSLQRVAVAAGQDHQLKTVHLVVQVVAVLPIQAQVAQLLPPVKVLLAAPIQLLEIKLLVVVVRLRLGPTVGQVVVMVVMVLQTVFLVPL